MADTMVRYKRMQGYETYFLTGSDEHGQKIERVAKAQGVTPIEYTDKIVATFQALWKRLLISNDDFIRTTQPRHMEVVQKIFQTIYDKGDIYKSEYEVGAGIINGCGDVEAFGLCSRFSHIKASLK